MQIGLGGLRMSPETFWNCTLREFLCAIEGFAASRGGGKKRREAAAPMTRERLEELAAMYPDEPGSAAKYRKGA